MLRVNQLIGFGAAVVAAAANPNVVYVGNQQGIPSTTYTATGASMSSGWASAPPAADRLVVVPVRSGQTFGFFKTASVVCGGVPLELVPAPLIGGFSITSGIEWWFGLVPTGSAPDVVVTTNAAEVQVGVFALYNQAPYILDVVPLTATSQQAAFALNDIETQAGGVVLAMIAGQTATATYTEAWSGSETVTEDFEGNDPSGNFRSMLAHFETTTALTTQDLTITGSGSGPNIAQASALSFGPTAPAASKAPSYWHSLSYGNRTGTLTASTTVSLGGGTIDNLIDGAYVDNTTDSCWFTAGQTLKTILQVDAGADYLWSGFRWLQSSANSHGICVAETSPDNATWTQQGASFDLGGGALTDVSWYRAVQARYFRIRQISGSTNGSPWLRECLFKIASVGGANRPVRESGARAAYITTTTTATLAGGSISNLVDGYSNINNYTFATGFTASQSSKEIKFDFGAGMADICTGLRLLQDIPGSHGTWDVQFSNDDVTYAAAVATITLGAAQDGVNTWANSTVYRYMRLTQVSGTTNGSPWLLEMEFKLA